MEETGEPSPIGEKIAEHPHSDVNWNSLNSIGYHAGPLSGWRDQINRT